MKKILSIVCTMALMLTMFSIPTNAAEQVVGTDYDYLVVDRLNYHFYLRVVGASAVTEGESTGLRQMSCSMYIETNSGIHWNSGVSTLVMEVALSGYGEISTSQSRCSVNGASGSVVLVV